MKIKRLIWLDDIIEKLVRKHNVSQDEVRDILAYRPYFRFIEKGHQLGENVYTAMGQTNSGRYLIVFFVYKKNGYALILSARDMTNNERKRYEQR